MVSGQGQTIKITESQLNSSCLLLFAIDISETQYRTEWSFYQIMKSEIKRSGQGRTIKITES